LFDLYNKSMKFSRRGECHPSLIKKSEAPYLHLRGVTAC
jgi:hypothetical protein